MVIKISLNAGIITSLNKMLSFTQLCILFRIQIMTILIIAIIERLFNKFQNILFIIISIIIGIVLEYTCGRNSIILAKISVLISASFPENETLVEI
ncbi:hypothetical protein C1645_783758 [Glomus cerebriforme]|uniref:Uncharacterized protein n=1 Tax=Glomus cerebriforme TaxID=658196 RepID=A0A397SEF4_9GLOM|nr:hypothetical protein C1645_783758 [Glomus cerebriforme]